MKMIELFKGKGLFKKILYSDQLFAVPHFLSESINHCRKAFETAVNLLKIFWNNLPDSYIIYCEFFSTAEKCPHHVGIFFFSSETFKFLPSVENRKSKITNWSPLWLYCIWNLIPSSHTESTIWFSRNPIVCKSSHSLGPVIFNSYLKPNPDKVHQAILFSHSSLFGAHWGNKSSEFPLSDFTQAIRSCIDLQSLCVYAMVTWIGSMRHLFVALNRYAN